MFSENYEKFTINLIVGNELIHKNSRSEPL
jgi:hypothetical protein